MNIKKTEQSSDGTSYFGHTVVATVEQLVKAIGKPTFNYNDGIDKVNIEWIMEVDSGGVFTVYDWSYYRPIRHDEPVSWHIGGFDSSTTSKIKTRLEELLG